jgi:hypothetical protein
MFKYTGPYRYHLKIAGRDEDRVIEKRMSWNEHNSTFEEVRKFSSPATLNRRPKIYIIKKDDEIYYVGYSSQSISTRLLAGMKKGGTYLHYKGYKWKDLDKIELFVFVFDKDLKTPMEDDDKEFKLFAEAVEAELVYKIRTQSGKWPLYQNEIHFNNYYLIEATEMATEIYETLTMKNDKK